MDNKRILTAPVIHLADPVEKTKNEKSKVEKRQLKTSQDDTKL